MRTRVTVIPEDKTIIVDGRALAFNFNAPEDLHALQWRSGSGHVEREGAENEMLSTADYNLKVKPYVDAWEAEKLRLEEAAAAPPPPPTPEEITAIAQGEAARLLTAKAHEQLAQAETFAASEFATLAKAGLFEAWVVGAKYVKGNRFVHEGIVYEAQQEVTAQAHQAPGSAGMLAIYRPISADPDTGAEPDGSLDNPYSFISGMDVSSGKYYTFEGKLYLAKADMKPCVWNPGTPGLWQWELVG